MLALSDVSVRYDDVPAVRRRRRSSSPDGQVLAVLGPSGLRQVDAAACGRRARAARSAARRRWDGADLPGSCPTHKRGFALMFQDGQLFDHLTVARNVGYAPAAAPGSATLAARVAELLDLVGLAGYADRLPATLSGGERQRVALARSLAVDPRLLLLDEPLSALDAGLRERLAADLRRILRAAGTTALMVTHDHDEAFAVADRLAVMRAGGSSSRARSPRCGAPRSTPTPRCSSATRACSTVPPPRCRAAVVRGPPSPRPTSRCPPLARWPYADRRQGRPEGRWRGGRRRGSRRTRCGWSSTSPASARWTPWRRSTSTRDRARRCSSRVDATRTAVVGGRIPSDRADRSLDWPRVSPRLRPAHGGLPSAWAAWPIIAAARPRQEPGRPGGQLPRAVVAAAAAAAARRAPARPAAADPVVLAAPARARSRIDPRAAARRTGTASASPWSRSASSASTWSTSATATSSRSCRSSWRDKYDRELHLLDRALLFGHDPATDPARGLRHQLRGHVLSYDLPVVPAAGAAGRHGLGGLVAQPLLRLLVRHLAVHRVDARHRLLLRAAHPRPRLRVRLRSTRTCPDTRPAR